MIQTILSGFAAVLIGLLAAALFYVAARLDDDELTRGKVPYSGYHPDLPLNH